MAIKRGITGDKIVLRLLPIVSCAAVIVVSKFPNDIKQLWSPTLPEFPLGASADLWALLPPDRYVVSTLTNSKE